MKSVSAVPPAPSAISPWFRRYLYLTAAITGGVILIIEILGAKMLAPYLGTSHFVWTAQITVTLVALAVGYYLGGRWADRGAKLDRFYAAILGAALYLCLAVWMCQPLAYFCLDFKLAVGALLASAAMFLPPLTLLAMACPFLVRTLTDSLQVVGRQVGQLSAISTLGSVVGTLLIGYVLIPLLPNSTTMILTALLLIAVSAGYFLLWRRKARLFPLVILALVLDSTVAYGAFRQESTSGWSGTQELFHGNSNFGLMQVLQNRSGVDRYYLNDFLVQNTYDTTQKQSVSLFTYMLYWLARAYTPNLQNALCIGLGVGIVPMELARSGVNVDVIEINPAVVPVAKGFFGLQPDLLHLHFGDGRWYLNQDTRQYDTIVLDAFLGDSMPTHLFSQEAFQAMAKRLTPQGTLVINSFVSFEPGADFFGRSLEATLRSVFPSVKVHDGGTGNVFFVASRQADLHLLGSPDLDAVHPNCRSQVQAAFVQVLPPITGPALVLTDDYNPVEVYDAANRERLRRRLASGMRP